MTILTHMLCIIGAFAVAEYYNRRIIALLKQQNDELRGRNRHGERRPRPARGRKQAKSS